MASRPSLPASSSDFSLPPSSVALASSAHLADEFNPLILRFRRPSLLAPPRASFFSEGRLHSPLVSSFTIPLVRRHTSSTISGEESESDREKMSTDSPSPSVDSGATTPITPCLPEKSSFTDKDKSTSSVDSDTSMKSASSDSSAPDTANSLSTVRPRTPSTPPRRSANPERDDGREATQDGPAQRKLRRLSHPPKMPRIRTLVAESHTEENEVKSEAQFQRFVSSFSEHPTMPRTPRALSDRGRYPEDATLEEPSHDADSSDEEDEAEEPAFSFTHPQSEPINISKSVTPAQSINGDDVSLSESPGTMPMDIDMPSSASGSPKLTAWRYTPPPTSSTSAIRSNKRKLDDRYDPYPTSNKRRAVSPSVSYLRENHTSYFSPRTPTGSGRISLPHPIAIPVAPSSGASSPIVPSSLGNGSRPVSWGPNSVLSSPTLRAQIGLASPVLRPMMRRREEREVDGTGDAVGGLTLE
ncbi:hypothetical protein EIP86_009755 [Pleurotus ostreatoroseus]|nr:hypothetical protein EIP86_009755 [Pleurotus ostreatoroseus]